MFIEHREYIIRKLILSDASSLFKNYKSNIDCAKYIRSKPHTNIKQTRELIDKCLTNYQASNPKSLIFAIAEPKDTEVIGLLIFVFNDNHAEIHFGLSNSFSGRGIATSICFEGVTWLKKLGIKSIRTQPYSEHSASLRVLEKCGFKNHGELQNYSMFPQLGENMQNCVDMRIEFE